MNCKDVREQSSLYLSHELDVMRTLEFRRHVEGCAACAAEMEYMAEVDVRVRDAILSEPVETAAMEERVRAAVGASRQPWLRYAASIAAVLVVGAITARVWMGPDRACTAAASDHRLEVVQNQKRTWHSGLPELGEMAEGQGVAASAVERLAPDGFRLEHGKLCRLDGRVYLHLVYSNGSEKVSVFLRQRDSGAATQIRNAETGAEHVAYFDTPRVSAMIVADRSIESAIKMARIAQQIL